MKLTGMEGSLELTEAALLDLLRGYCRESGVRNLQKHIEKIFRKAALIRVRDEKDRIVVDSKNLHDFVGSPVFTRLVKTMVRNTC